eukprot:TRINITY_DN1722_c0_g2_i1.p1 TRINITY_DN1722_c0_g2~~TRINITY_DN1722_c0_g2_i1.p1  ORF type:complete len:783 (+),score=250.21 TRINITY_DN1722_c0_g2_i1:78-2426(+)
MALRGKDNAVSKNNLLWSRETVKRCPEHKDIVRTFLQTFEKREGAPDAKFGFQKYKALLRSAVNRNLETIFVDLNDLEEYCRKMLLEEGGANIALRDACVHLMEDVERQPMKYTKLFYEACETEKPERDEGFNHENAYPAREMVQQWRERQQQKLLEAGQGIGEVPPELMNPFYVKFKPRMDIKAMNFREVVADMTGALVQLECLVVRCSEVKPKIEVVTYQCEVCESEIFQSVESDTYSPPKVCPATRCRERNQTGRLRQNNRTSKFGKYQEMKVQELSEHVPVGGVPRSILVVLSGDLCRSVGPGDAITLTGVYTPRKLPWYAALQRGTTQEMYIDAHFVRKHKAGYADSEQDQTVLANKVEDVHQKSNIYEHASKSIAPEIFGHGDVKKALLLSLIGGTTKTMKDGLKIRGEIHSLYMGDPGVAKSQLLKQVCKIAPRSVYTTGKGASGVGLTASVIRDKLTGEVTLEGGALVLADMGVCCIDEFDKMEESDRTAIHEVMEQQSVSIAKAGITTTLNTRTTIMAAANPAYGRYDPYKSPVENIQLPPALLSRFDLLFLLLDTVDEDKDTQLAMHVTKVHSFLPNKENATNEAEGENGDVLNLGFKPLDAKLMRSYVRRARTYEPLVVESLEKDIADAYISLREEEKRGDLDSRKSYTTPRTLLSILRLSQAHARARFSNKVERQDFEEAMRLMKVSKESVELSAPAKRGQNPIDLVNDILAGLTKGDGGWVAIETVVSMGGHKALSRDQVMDALEEWEKLSVVVINPEKTMVKFVTPLD